MEVVTGKKPWKATRNVWQIFLLAFGDSPMEIVIASPSEMYQWDMLKLSLVLQVVSNLYLGINKQSGSHGFMI
jgi:hypothetical protein